MHGCRNKTSAWRQSGRGTLATPDARSSSAGSETRRLRYHCATDTCIPCRPEVMFITSLQPVMNETTPATGDTGKILNNNYPTNSA